MEKIKLLYVENIISRQDEQAQQQITFSMLVDNISYDKDIDVIWVGEDSIWQTLPAHFKHMHNDQECWQAQLLVPLSEQQALPGNIQFGLRFRVFSDEYWDNNSGQNYFSDADSGIKLPEHKSIQNINFADCFKSEQSTIPVTIAVSDSFKAEKVTIYWTIDNWATNQLTDCSYKLNYWDQLHRSNARNPNQYGVCLWTGQIHCDDAFRLQYSICCESADGETHWENNEGNNYAFQRERLKILILNLHCYQEENQDEKFTQIAKAVNDLGVDIVCLQEVAEYWRDGEGDWESNSAKIINDRLHKPFHIHTDWSHLGFDKYREGVAILSRYPLFNHQARYVSESHDIYSIHSRKVVMAQAYVPYIGLINVYSAHLSWLEDGFEGQFTKLHEWAESNHSDSTKATLLCGDFNVTAGTEGYELVVKSNQYDDQFLEANEHGVFEKIFRVNDAHWQDLLADDYRIDYIFMNRESDLQVTSAKIIFTEQDYGSVSDHCGYFMTFEPKINYSLVEGE